MKLKLLFFRKEYCFAVFFLFVNLQVFAQSIGIPTVVSSGGPIQVSFTVANGSGAASYFTGSTSFTVYLSNAAGANFAAIATFTSSVFPAPADAAAAVIYRTVSIPSGTAPGTGYRIAVSSTNPVSLGTVGNNASQPFTLFDAFSMPSNLDGFIKCSSPAITYYVLTITNTGDLIDSYNLTKSQNLYPLGSSFLSLSGASISSTPSLDPGESYTFMMLFETPNGTPPDNWNTTIVTATSVGNPAITHTTNISTYIYCGNNNANLPDSPDMEIVKTANTATATVSDFIDYTITIRNTSTKNASNPVIKDFLPSNAQLISYNKAAGETRNVVFNYNSGNNTLSALVQSTMTSASLPLTINIRVKTSCQSVPVVTNSAEVYSVSGDHNSLNDVSSATTSVSYNLAGSGIGTWTGSYNNDWFDCRNWSGGIVPNNTISAVIPSGTPNSEINSQSTLAPSDKTARTHHLTIQSGASLSMTNASLLNLAGNWSCSGNFLYGNGTVIFGGAVSSSYQYMYDATNKSNFYNLTINGSNGSKGVSITDGYGLFVNNNLDLLSGDIRLNGAAQLVQTKSGLSTNSTTGNGKIFIDQKGKTNIYSYNYWCSPVGSNNSYTVGSVMKDGTNPDNPQNINWIGGYDGSPSTPISLASYWIYKYQNQSGSYAGWSAVGSNGILSAGQGYTLKGGGAATSAQNYTFAGKPNNGNFTSLVSSHSMNLCGNPYPCALDAYAFIDDNAATITGTLYFWEQFSTNSSHITANYEGGYATLTKTGATPPASPAGVSSLGSSSRIPGRYIPVAQGFLLFGNAAGGTITFSNSQRAFVRETDLGSNPMFRTTAETEKGNSLKKIRLGFTSETTKRQLLLGFMDTAASASFDNGYDAVQLDTRDDDAYFLSGSQRLVINARGAFNESDAIPVGVKLANGGDVTFSLDGQENFDSVSAIYLYDAVSGQNYNIKDGAAVVSLAPGQYDNRFSVRFTMTSANKNIVAGNDAAVFYQNHILNISSNNNSVTLVELYNMLGQKITEWHPEKNQYKLALPVDAVESGTYIAKVTVSGSVISKVIVVQE